MFSVRLRQLLTLICVNVEGCYARKLAVGGNLWLCKRALLPYTHHKYQSSSTRPNSSGPATEYDTCYILFADIYSTLNPLDTCQSKFIDLLQNNHGQLEGSLPNCSPFG